VSITPKEWKSFQHYKERRPPWIKLHRILLDNIEFLRLPVASRALAPMLWLYAAEFDEGTITASFEDIAFRLRMSDADFMAALKPLLDKGFFVTDEPDSGALADCKTPNAPKTEGETEGEKESRAKNRPERTPSRFDEFWRECPRRDGPNPRKPAETRFSALVKTGLDPEFLIAEAKKWAEAEGRRGNIGTRFVPQVVTWLNQQRWSDHAAVAFLQSETSGDQGKLSLDQAVEMFARLGMWSRYSPINDVSKAPPELLAKHGLGPDGRKRQPAPEAA